MLAAEAHTQDSVPRLGDFSGPSLMVPLLQGNDAATAIQELSAALQREGLLPDLLQFYHAVLNREYLCHTVTAPGWAMPHAVAKGLVRPCFALGRWVPPRCWLKNVQPVSLIFLFAVPGADAGGYLRLISGVARLSKRPELVEPLLTTDNGQEMFEVLSRVSLAPRTAVA